MAVVSVDMKTGKTTVDRIVGIDDVGVIGNPVCLDGQAYSGIAHSIGYALWEDYDDVKKHNNLAGMGIATANMLPDDIELIHMCTPRDTNPFGSSGGSEAFQSGDHMAGRANRIRTFRRSTSSDPTSRRPWKTSARIRQSRLKRNKPFATTSG